MLESIQNTLRFYYYRKKNNWTFPSNMAHTSGVCMADGTYEPELTKLISEHIGKGATVIDVGANIGYFARLFAELAGETGSVIAFETETQNYLSLSENVSGYKQIVPIAMAVSNTNSLAEFQLSSHASCHSLLETGNHQISDSVTVLTMKLDTFWELYLDRHQIDCIKVDVEGAEIAVLEGMQDILDAKAVNLMILEFCPQIMVNAGYEPVTLYKHLEPFFCVNVAEEEYKTVVGDGLVSSANQFNKLKNNLLESGEFLNCNLFCRQKRGAQSD